MSSGDFQHLFSPEASLRYYSLARHALSDALILLGIGRGDKVLLPDYLCRDLLASLAEVGAEPVWYMVGTDLEPLDVPDKWPVAKAVLAVNYFGFAQNLAPFEVYSAQHGATIIEDNAHGFLSRDSQGRLLGTRTPLGLFSFRKTLLAGRGAGLHIANPSAYARLPVQLEFSAAPLPRAIRIRQWLRRLTGSRYPEYCLAHFLRWLRVRRGLSAIPLPAIDAEVNIPDPAQPDAFLLPILAGLACEKEANRRRRFYNMLLEEALGVGLKPLFPRLPANAAPYGLPLFAETPDAIASLAQRHSLDYFKWPDLPDERAGMAPAHYSRIYLISFL